MPAPALSSNAVSTVATPTASDTVAGSIATSIATVLTSASRFGRLTTLELSVAGSPDLAMLVRGRGMAGAGELVVWFASVERNSWHGGLLLVATAPSASRHRRATVEDAAALVDRLLVADRRCTQAELLAVRANELAGLDALTQLGNRRAWRRALDEESARATRYSSASAIVVVDLDGLKRINDTDGHAAGDAHLLRASAAVRAASRSVDIVCRLGGDEFGVLAPETGLPGASKLAGRLVEELARARVEASIGVATTDGGDLEAAWHDADAEMYRHKRARAAR